MNDIKKALDSGMKNMHFNKSLVSIKNNNYSWINSSLKGIAAAAAVITLTIVFMTGTGKTVFAYAYQSIASILGMNATVENYTTIIGSSVSENGITVTLNDVIVAEEKLILSINILDGQKMKRDEFGNRIRPGYDFNQVSINNPENSSIKIYMDGKEIPIAGLSGTGTDIDDYTVNYITEYYIGHIDWEKEHDFKIAISEINKPRGSGEKSEGISGKWEFNFAASGDEISKDTKVVRLNDVLKYDNGSLYFEKFVSNKYEKVLYVSSYEATEGRGYGEIGNAVDLIGYDDLGNRVSLYAQADYFNKQGAVFICVGGTNISEDASTLTLQAAKNWTDAFDSEKATVTIAIK